MRSITAFLAKTSHALGGSVAILMLSTAMINSVAAADTETTYNNSCAACHDSGALNAPKKGDSAKWQQLKQQKGLPALINSVKGGMIQMPAGGLCDSCSDDDYRKLIDYMSK
ncbi:c-type cytochrome [Psychrobacter sp. CAL346-MNA-CIBAN-0220]|uniref:c-type cytochrome n=1 Tax=Psychrobacter sp. CAL346-MNA-CIBAN-0220 TaxID=3140457 RepID=UPI003333B9E5